MMSRLAACAVIALALWPGARARAAALDVELRDGASQPVADAAVYAVPASGASDARGASAAIEQADREFVPFMSIVQAGTAVSFPNRDPILHHVYSFSAAKPFEIKLYSGKSPQEVVFDKPGVVALGCNIHDWMIAYVVVVPTPYFARSDAQGHARIRDLPPGRYELHAWHPQQRVALPAQPVLVESAAASRASFRLELQPRKAKYKPPLDRLKY